METRKHIYVIRQTRDVRSRKKQSFPFLNLAEKLNTVAENRCESNCNVRATDSSSVIRDNIWSDLDGEGSAFSCGLTAEGALPRCSCSMC